MLPLPKSTHANRIAENAEMGFILSVADMKILDAISE
jgi:diketogulonate reductase-like aldo/keto reductase